MKLLSCYLRQKRNGQATAKPYLAGHRGRRETKHKGSSDSAVFLLD